MFPTKQFIALLLLALWLPSTLHCDLERAAIDFLAHDHENTSSACHGNGKDCHAIEDVDYAASSPSPKISLPADSFSEVHSSLVRAIAQATEPNLAVPRHVPPRATVVTWQFVRRAAPLARAPELNA